MEAKRLNANRLKSLQFWKSRIFHRQQIWASFKGTIIIALNIGLVAVTFT